MCNGKIAGCKSPALLVRNQVACVCVSVCESESIIHPPVRVNSERWGWISVEANDWAPLPQIPPSTYKWTAWRWDTRWGRGAITPVVIIRLLWSPRILTARVREGVGRDGVLFEAYNGLQDRKRWSTDRLRQCDRVLLHSFNSISVSTPSHLCGVRQTALGGQRCVIWSGRASTHSRVLKKMTEGSSITVKGLLCFWLWGGKSCVRS